MAKEKDASAKTQRSGAAAENQDWREESESEGFLSEENEDYEMGGPTNSSSASARTQQSDAPAENQDWLKDRDKPGRRKSA